jgi:GNAT superfamily N-acetyltransferase
MESAAPSGHSSRAIAREEQLYLRDGTVVRLRATAGVVAADERAAIAARDADGRAVGGASYARVYGPRAQLELDVDDAFWHRGLPEALLASACARAAAAGISTFLARVPSSDMRLLALLRQVFAARESRDGAYVDVEFSTSTP